MALRKADGLKQDEKVIVNGMISAMPGTKVNPHEVPIPTESLNALESVAAAPPIAPPGMRTAAQSVSQPSAEARQ